MEGGDYLKYSADQLKDWKKSIGYAPTQLRYKIQPIHALIADSALRQEFIIAASKYSQAVLVSSTTLPDFVPTSSEGVGDFQAACDAGWAMQFAPPGAIYADEYLLPLSCTSYEWSKGYLQDPEPCNCQTTGNAQCQSNFFVTEVTGFSGHFNNPSPALPMTCCGVCVTL